MSCNRVFKINIGLVEVAAFCVVVACLTGCGPQYPETSGVHGRITYDGKPVAADRANKIECEICFWPEDGRRPARGDIDGEGRYRLNSFSQGDGAIPGKYKVTIKAVKVHPPSEGSHNGDSWLEWLAPKRYENQATSGLTAVVEPGDNEINFDLPKE